MGIGRGERRSGGGVSGGIGERDIGGVWGGDVLRKNIRKWVVVGDKKLDKYTRM